VRQPIIVTTLGILGLIWLACHIATPAEGAPAPQPGQDLVMGSDDWLRIDYDIEIGNLTLRKEATLVVQEGTLTVNGLLRLSGEARLMLVDGDLELFPGSLEGSVIPVIMEDQSMLRLEQGSKAHFHPQPTNTTAPFIDLYDQSRLVVYDSTFQADLPPVPYPEDIVNTPVVAGVILLEGDAVWEARNSKLVGNLNLNEFDDLLGRWYWASIQQRGRIELKDTTVNLKNAEHYPVFKPVAGTFKMHEVEVLAGLLELEVINRAEISDSVIHHGLSVGDMAQLTLTDSTVNEAISVGAPDPKAPPGLQSTAMFTAIRLQLNNTLAGASYATIDISDSNVEQLSMKNNTNLRFENGVVSSLRLYDHARAVVLNTTLNRTTLNQNASLDLIRPGIDPAGVQPQIPLWRAFINGTYPSFYMEEATITQVIFYPNQTVKMVLDEATIEKLYVYEAPAVLDLELINNSRFLNLTGRYDVSFDLVITDVGSTYTSFDHVRDDLNWTLDLQVYHRLSIATRLNDDPIPGQVVLTGLEEGSQDLVAEEGECHVDLPRDPTREITVDLSYLGFSVNENIMLDRSHTIEQGWSDRVSPKVQSLTLEPERWNLLDPLTVKVKVTDDGVQAMAEVVLIYRIEDGPWKEVSMFPLGSGTYAAQIPGQDRNEKVEYQVRVTDMAGNTRTTSPESITVGTTESWLLRLTVVGVLGLVAGLVLRFGIQRHVSKKILREERS